jgi:phage gpG-like protein
MALIKIRDGISSDLRLRAKAASDRRPLLQAMGQAVKSIGIRAFSDPAKRAQAWAPRQDKKTHALLQKSTILRKSIRVVAVTNDTVIVGSDRKYAAAQQLGVPKNNLPARPFLPFYQTGQITELGRQGVERALKLDQTQIIKSSLACHWGS